MKLLSKVTSFFHQLPDQYLYKVKWPLQRFFKGYDDHEVYELDASLVKFMLPRLKAFKSMDRSSAFSSKRGEGYLDAMIWSFEHWKDQFNLAPYFKGGKFDDKRYLEFKKKLDKGFALFGKHWQQLCD